MLGEIDSWNINSIKYWSMFHHIVFTKFLSYSLINKINFKIKSHFIIYIFIGRKENIDHLKINQHIGLHAQLFFLNDGCVYSREFGKWLYEMLSYRCQRVKILSSLVCYCPGRELPGIGSLYILLEVFYEWDAFLLSNEENI